VGRAIIHDMMGEYAKAISDCNKAISIAPKTAPAYLIRGRALHGLGDHFNGNRDIAKAIQLDPKLTK
jgi:Flp pilus assembly protein TadD